MDSLSNWFGSVFSTGWKTILSTIIDISLVSFAIYKLIMLAKRTRAWRIMWGLVVFFILIYITDQAQLQTVNWLLNRSLQLLPVAVVILFYPELRHALEELGRLVGWGKGFIILGKEDLSGIIQSIVTAACRMSSQQVGALIVLEREAGLDDIADTGAKLDAVVTAELLGTIFHPGSPLHDGAVIIRGNRIVAAGCTLPLSESVHIGTMVHTRHKAALGVTEESDAAVVVVSEETGTISLSLEGKLHRGLNEDTLTEWLKTVFNVGNDHGRRAQFAKTVDSTLRRARMKQ